MEEYYEDKQRNVECKNKKSFVFFLINLLSLP